jgi:hypothetical protein
MDKTTLARTWADAIPLGKFAASRVEGLAKGSGNASHSDSPFVDLARAVQYQAGLRSAFTRAYEETINDLIAGRIVCLGRKSKSYEFQVIDPAFWIGATVDWGANAAMRGRQSMIDLRVSIAPSNTSAQPEPRQGPGRPSKAAAIRAAIVEYAKSDPRLGRPPLERYRAYHAYLSERGFNPRREGGFKDKTFEKYEREFRRKNK